MKTVIHRLFWIWQYEEEEAWLNGMSMRGEQLVELGFCRYVFQKGQPREYTYRMELLENHPKTQKGLDYISFVEDTGAEMVGSLFRWVYFRKRGDEGFNLFSDLGSRIAHLRRVLVFIFIISMLLLCNWPNVIRMAYVELGSGFSFFSGFVFGLYLVLTGLLTYGIIRIAMKISKLRKEQQLRN